MCDHYKLLLFNQTSIAELFSQSKRALQHIQPSNFAQSINKFMPYTIKSIIWPVNILGPCNNWIRHTSSSKCSVVCTSNKCYSSLSTWTLQSAITRNRGVNNATKHAHAWQCINQWLVCTTSNIIICYKFNNAKLCEPHNPFKKWNPTTMRQASHWISST